MALARSAKVPNDRVERARPGEPADLWVYTASPKSHWSPRKAGDAIHAEHPGTAIQLDHELYEVVSAEETVETARPIRYGLKRWDSHHVVRQSFAYTPEGGATAAGSSVDEGRSGELRSRILWLFPLAGLAPGSVQREWGRKTGLPMVWIAVGSALFFASAAFAVLAIRLSYSVLHYFIAYFLLDSVLRLLWMAVSGKPRGTLLLSVPYGIWEGLTARKPRARRKPEWLTSVFEDDEVIRRPPRQLIVRSMLFDDALAGPRPVRFEGLAYRPVRWHKEGKGLRRRWIFELEALEADPGNCREYTHPRAPERQAVVETYTRRRDLAHSFAFIWGLYPRKDQLRLEILYRFGATKFTALTAAALLGCAAIEIALTLRVRPAPERLAGPIYLSLESLYRLYRSQLRGLATGSLVGYVLRWFIRPPG